MVTNRPTMAEIAREANVAISTVSKVLNGHTDVSAITRRQIEQLLSDRGYQRPTGSRRPGRRTDLVDLVISEMDNVWGVSILGGVQRQVEAANLALVVSSVHHRESLTRRWLESLLARGSLGAILVLSELTDHQRAELDRRGLPFVVVDGVSQPPPGVPSIGVTNFAGGFSATAHLAGLGHRRIAAIGGPEGLQCTRARIAGYRAALESAGLPTDRRLVRYGDFHHAGGLRATHELLALPEPPTAIFAGSDLHATGVYEALRRAGHSVPHDMSVVGFDDLSFTEWTAPPLTTVRQPLHEMGAAAARTLLRIIGGERLESARIELETRLVVRDSTARPGLPLDGAHRGPGVASRG